MKPSNHNKGHVTTEEAKAFERNAKILGKIKQLEFKQKPFWVISNGTKSFRDICFN